MNLTFASVSSMLSIASSESTPSVLSILWNGFTTGLQCFVARFSSLTKVLFTSEQVLPPSDRIFWFPDRFGAWSSCFHFFLASSGPDCYKVCFSGEGLFTCCML